MKIREIRETLYEKISTMKVISTHTHILSDQQLKDTDVSLILGNSYLAWMYGIPGNSYDERKKYIQANRCNSYFRWLSESFRSIYGLELTAENYEELDQCVKEKHKDGKFHLEIMKKHCNFEVAILDKFDLPGSDNGHPEFFLPAFRVNMFMLGYDREKRDYRGVNAYQYIAKDQVHTFEDYLKAVEDVLRERKKAGIYAIKNASAYDRNQVYVNDSKAKAAKAFDNPDATEEDKKNFSDYMMFTITSQAEELDLPIQIHAGLGNIDNTRAIGMRKLIDRFPQVKFDIFHASYPWTSDVLALLHYFKNTYVNLCWLPIVSTTEGKDFIKKALEVANAHRICWGCDVRTGEDSFGTVLAIRHVLADALAEMVFDGAFDLAYAEYIAKRILIDNPRELYKIAMKD